jgi:hypothetical protein
MKTVWLSLRFLGLAAVLFPLFFLPPLRSLCGGLAAVVAAVALGVTSDGSFRGSEGASESIELGSQKLPRGMIGLTTRTGAGSGSRTAEVETFNYIRNVPLFWAALVAAARVRRGRMVVVGLVGSLALLLLDGLVVASAAGEALANVSSPQPIHLNAGYQVLAVLAVLHTTGGVFVAPVLIGALAGLVLLGEPRPAASAAAGRNQPCPCGSGLKFKRCCGR